MKDDSDTVFLMRSGPVPSLTSPHLRIRAVSGDQGRPRLQQVSYTFRLRYCTIFCYDGIQSTLVYSAQLLGFMDLPQALTSRPVSRSH
jgi:hypothetical protein